VKFELPFKFPLISEQSWINTVNQKFK